MKKLIILNFILLWSFSIDAQTTTCNYNIINNTYYFYNRVGIVTATGKYDKTNNVMDYYYPNGSFMKTEHFFTNGNTRVTFPHFANTPYTSPISQKSTGIFGNTSENRISKMEYNAITKKYEVYNSCNQLIGYYKKNFYEEWIFEKPIYQW